MPDAVGFEDCDDDDIVTPQDATTKAMIAATGRFGLSWGAAKPGDYTPPRWLLRRYVQRGTVTALYGQPGTCKSFLALHAAMCLATGMPFNGVTPERCSVVYIAAEGQNSVRMRQEAWQERYGIAPDQNDFVLVTEPLPLLDDSTVDLFIELLDYEAARRGITVGLVVIDTLSQCCSGAEEQSAKEMTRAVSNMIRIRRRLNTSVLFIHHSGKDLTKGMRGSSAILANTDAALLIEKEPNETVGKMIVKRQKDGEVGVELGFETSVTPIPWLVAAGEEVTATLTVDFPQSASKSTQDMETLVALAQAVETEGRPLTVSIAMKRAGLHHSSFYEGKVCRLLPMNEIIEVTDSTGRGVALLKRVEGVTVSGTLTVSHLARHKSV